jgi:general secretion pathway protein D
MAAGLPATAAPHHAASGETYSFVFHDADLKQVAQEVLGAAGVPYVIEGGATARLTFRIEQRLTREQLLAAFEAVLNAQGLALVRNGDQVVITPEAKAKGSAAIRRAGEPSSGSGYELVAVPLAYAEPSEVAKALEAISSSSPVVYANDKLGLLLLGGAGRDLKSTLETIKIFDQDAFADSKIRWFELNQGQATQVAAELDRIAQGAHLSGVTIVPLRRLNGIIVFARSADTLSELARWVTKLDAPGKDAGTGLFVYHPKATSAEALARTLNAVIGAQTTGELQSTTADYVGSRTGSTVAAPITAAPATTTTVSSSQTTAQPDDPVRIGVDKETNTLIVFASGARWVQVQRILTEIDRAPRQILIEASILEVTLGKTFEFGVDWKLVSNNLTAGAINNKTGEVAASFPGLSVTYVDSNIEAAIRALGTRTAVEVMSAPKIIALDNRTAHLQVGDQVPVVTQSSQSQSSANAPLTNTVDYRNTGVILDVTPRVAGDDSLVLEVSQEVSNVARTSTSGIDSPTIQQRRFASALILKDGGLVALGGLISSNRSNNDSGVPGLKDAPVIGRLFRSQSRSVDRTELIVLLTAKVLRDQASTDAAMADLFHDMHDLQVHGLLPASSS